MNETAWSLAIFGALIVVTLVWAILALDRGLRKLQADFKQNTEDLISLADKDREAALAHTQVVEASLTSTFVGRLDAMERRFQVALDQWNLQYEYQNERLVELGANLNKSNEQINGCLENLSDTQRAHEAKLADICDKAPLIWQAQPAVVGAANDSGQPGHPLAHVPYIYHVDEHGGNHYACRYCSEILN